MWPSVLGERRSGKHGRDGTFRKEGENIRSTWPRISRSPNFSLHVFGCQPSVRDGRRLSTSVADFGRSWITGNVMGLSSDAGSTWDRVAAELRTCREQQQRTYGRIDNALLGRYLAGET